VCEREMAANVGDNKGSGNTKKPDFNYHVEIVDNKVRITVNIELGIEDIMDFIFKAVRK